VSARCARNAAAARCRGAQRQRAASSGRSPVAPATNADQSDQLPLQSSYVIAVPSRATTCASTDAAAAILVSSSTETLARRAA